MLTNLNLNRAKVYATDEFYTPLDAIDIELIHYTDHFRDRVIYCNCDDYRVSNFYKWFKDRFDLFGLRGLLATGYVAGGHGLYCYYDGSAEDVRELEGDGDFRSPECIDLLGRADVICTNPPFSLFSDYIASILDKRFIVMGPLNAVTYLSVFPLLRDGLVWVGLQNKCVYTVPVDDQPGKYKRQKLGNIEWFTNLDSDIPGRSLVMRQFYDPDLYPHYDNYDAIEVRRLRDVPCDYYGVMGVPITYVEYHRSGQFDLLGMDHGSGWGYDGGVHIEGHPDSARINGKKVYKRLFIRRKQK